MQEKTRINPSRNLQIATAPCMEEIHTKLEGLRLTDLLTTTNSLAGFEAADENLRTDTENFLQALNARGQAAIRFASGESHELKAEPLPDDPTQRLASAIDGFSGRAASLKAAQTDPGLRQIMEQERKQLQARRILSDNIELFLIRRADLKILHQLVACKESCDTTTISRKIKDLRRQFITEEYKRRLGDEVSFFGIEYLPLKLADRSGHGTSYIEVGIDSKQMIKNNQILSEGEHKALALVYFFAEIGGIPAHCGLIFDDPVSSLDHSRRRKVAERIVSEAQKGRQVVVFTHDMVFFHELRDTAACVTPGVPLVTHEVRRTVEHGFGTVFEDDEPWLVKKVGERISAIEKRLSLLKAVTDKNGEDYRKAVEAFYTDLRETWERLVESDLLNGVINRFECEVKTQSLREVTVEDEDYKRVYFGMKRASEWSGHDRAAAKQGSLPDPDTASRDLQDLREFYKSVKDRKNQIRERRNKLEAPPKATMA